MTTRICSEVQVHLPAHLDGTLRGWRRRLVRLHLRRCDECRAELARQEHLVTGLASLGRTEADAAPPDGLLDALLAQAGDPGVRGRLAVPARGAVSGARPELSAALLLAGGLAGTAVGYGIRSCVRALRARAGVRS